MKIKIPDTCSICDFQHEKFCTIYKQQVGAYIMQGTKPVNCRFQAVVCLKNGQSWSIGEPKKDPNITVSKCKDKH